MLALLRNGDRIVIDAAKGTMDVALSEAEQAIRQAHAATAEQAKAAQG